MGERQAYSEESRAKRRGRRIAPATDNPRREAHHVGMEAHRAAGVGESGRDGDGNRVAVLVMAISTASS